MKAYGITNNGLVRECNEDTIFVCSKQLGCLPNLFIIADGMGGHNAGEVASEISVNEFIQHCKDSSCEDIEKLLINGVEYVNKVIYNKAVQDEKLHGMGTTFVACSIINNELHVVNVGDSRLYIKHSDLEQITIDHSLVEELIRAGEITRDESHTHPERNKITRALGADKNVNADIFRININNIKCVLLCSDGLSNMVENKVINEILSFEESIENKVDKLLMNALENGGTDNVSIILIEL